jgi:hypothetical protein
MKERKNYFLGKAISRELKKWKSEEIGDLSWLSSRARDQTFWPIWEGISAKLNEELKKEGLWHRDGDGTVIPQENGIPSLKKRKSFSAEASENADESIYDPENLDEIYREERIADEDQLEDEEALPIDGEPAGGDSLHPYLPRLSVSSSHLLMRRYPLDLRESLARDLFDSYSLLADPDLLPALCFFEVGINDPETFQHVWEEAYKDGPFHKGGKEFSFREFQKDKLRLFHRLKREKERYFFRNPHLREKKQVATLWKRFEEALRSLTRKQWNVIKQVRVKKRSQTAVARDMRISLDSLRNRLEAAELKFRRALPELAGLFPSTTFRDNAKANYIYDGLFDKREKVAPLYRIDSKTRSKTQIPLRKGNIRQKAGVNAALIKAWAHETTPVPDFSFTEFFTQLYPKGMIDRQSAGESTHDKGSGGYTERSRAHKKRRASQEED